MSISKAIYLFAVCAALSSCYVLRAYRFRKFELRDIDKFRAQKVEKGSRPFSFFKADTNAFYLKQYLDTSLRNSLTYGFLVIQDDSIIYERYFNDLAPEQLFPSFSVAKSFVGTLAQVALQEGAITSFSEPVTNYLPWLLDNDKDWGRITIQRVLDMRTGVQSDETYSSPFSDVIKLGFTKNMKARLKRLRVDPYATRFDYKSVNTQILGAVIEAATGRSLPDYLEEKIWQPLGMERGAAWQTDARGKARAFCCLNATLRDFAKLGRLYLKRGNWEGKQIVSREWADKIFNDDTMRAYQGYKNHWWRSRAIRRFNDSLQAKNFIASQQGGWYLGRGERNGRKYFSAYNNLPGVFAQGMLGQFIYINPGKKLIIVRMGHNWRHPKYYAQSFIEHVATLIK